MGDDAGKARNRFIGLEVSETSKIMRTSARKV